MLGWRSLATAWVTQGRLSLQEERIEGLAAAPEAFARLVRGQTSGKLIVKPLPC